MVKQKLNSFPAAVLNRKYLVSEKETSLRDYLNANFYAAEFNRITVNQVRQLVNLEPGESLIINSNELKRLS